MKSSNVGVIILGMFKFIDSDLPGTVNDPNADFRSVVELVKIYQSGKSC